MQVERSDCTHGCGSRHACSVCREQDERGASELLAERHRQRAEELTVELHRAQDDVRRANSRADDAEREVDRWRTQVEGLHADLTARNVTVAELKGEVQRLTEERDRKEDARVANLNGWHFAEQRAEDALRDLAEMRTAFDKQTVVFDELSAGYLTRAEQAESQAREAQQLYDEQNAEVERLRAALQDVRGVAREPQAEPPSDTMVVQLAAPPPCCEWRDEYRLLSAKLDQELARNIHPQEHDFVPGDPECGWENQCAQPVFEGGARRHCGYPCEDHRSANSRRAPAEEPRPSEPSGDVRKFVRDTLTELATTAWKTGDARASDALTEAAAEIDNRWPLPAPQGAAPSDEVERLRADLVECEEVKASNARRAFRLRDERDALRKALENERLWWDRAHRMDQREILPNDAKLRLRMIDESLAAAPASPQAARDESVPAPGWEEVGVDYGWYERPIKVRGIAATWEEYDAEHGYAPAARPVPELPDGWHVEVLFEGLPQERVTLSDGRDAVAIGDAGCLSISLWAARKFIVIPAGVYRYLLARYNAGPPADSRVSELVAKWRVEATAMQHSDNRYVCGFGSARMCCARELLAALEGKVTQ